MKLAATLVALAEECLRKKIRLQAFDELIMTVNVPDLGLSEVQFEIVLAALRLGPEFSDYLLVVGVAADSIRKQEARSGVALETAIDAAAETFNVRRASLENALGSNWQLYNRLRRLRDAGATKFLDLVTRRALAAQCPDHAWSSTNGAKKC